MLFRSDEELNGKDIIAIPLAENTDMHIGFLTHNKLSLSKLGKIYIQALKKYARYNK